MKKIDYKKDSGVIYGNLDSEKSKFLLDVYDNEYSKDDIVYLFGHSITSMEYEPENPGFDGIIKMKNNNIDGLRTTLTSIVVGGREGLTLMVDFPYQDLVESSCIEMLKDLVNFDKGCNLIMTAKDLEEVKEFNFRFAFGINN